MKIDSKVPQRISIMRMEEYHTHYLGKTKMGQLFFGSETFFYNQTHHEVNLELQSNNRIDLAILYLFDKKGRFVEAKHWYTNVDNERAIVRRKLEEMVMALGEVTCCDTQVEPFEVSIDGIRCGLIPNDEFGSVELYPSSTISFQEPWDGEYYT